MPIEAVTPVEVADALEVTVRLPVERFTIRFSPSAPSMPVAVDMASVLASAMPTPVIS